MSNSAKLSIQKWGNSLAVRIPAAVANSARFSVGQTVELSVLESGVMVTKVGEPMLSLAQKLTQFDPSVHTGEVMSATPIGVEKW